MNPTTADRLRGIVSRFEGVPIAVVGDMCADVYVSGVPGRVSREAPVLVLVHEAEELIPGCAANTANNLRALGAEAHPIGLVGDDAAGHGIRAYFEERGVSTEGLIVSSERPTVTKTRIMAGGPTRLKHQLVRIDREPTGPLPAGVTQQILALVRDLTGMAGWVFSDYGYGSAAPGMANIVSGLRVADSRARIAEFQGFDALTPNEEEVAEVVGHPVLTDGQVRKAGKRILEESGAGNVVITRGNKGMALISSDGGELFLPVSGTDEVTDVTGAGDTVTGVLALALATGAEPGDAVRLANHAAGIVVTKAGAATLDRLELIERLEGEV